MLPNGSHVSYVNLSRITAILLREATSWALRTTRTEPAIGPLRRNPASEWRYNHPTVKSRKDSFEMSFSRPRDDRMIAGVCSGIARHFNIDPTVVRIAFVASLLLPGPQILIYLVAWLLMPDEATTLT